VCDLEAQEIFLTFPSRKILFEAKLTGSRYRFDSVKILDGGERFVYQERASEVVKIACFENYVFRRKS
jgi:hypothetical protein